MAKNLVIVESPAKAKTIKRYLGKDFVVKASIGHIKDLPSKGLGVDIQNNFEPSYEVIPDSSIRNRSTTNWSTLSRRGGYLTVWSATKFRRCSAERSAVA